MFKLLTYHDRSVGFLGQFSYMITLVSSGGNVVVLSKEKKGLLSLGALVQIPLPTFISEARNQRAGIWGRSRCHGSVSMEQNILDWHALILVKFLNHRAGGE